MFGKRDMGHYEIANVRTNEKFYILDSDLSLQDVTSGVASPHRSLGSGCLGEDPSGGSRETVGQLRDWFRVVRGHTRNFQQPKCKAVAGQKEILSLLGSLPCLTSKASRIKFEPQKQPSLTLPAARDSSSCPTVLRIVLF